MKLCKDCKYYIQGVLLSGEWCGIPRPSDTSECSRESPASGAIDPITGLTFEQKYRKFKHKYCADERAKPSIVCDTLLGKKDRCGPEGKHFESKRRRTGLRNSGKV